jgi:hypothetical protein
MSEETKKQNPTEVKKENAQPELTETDLKNVTGGGIKGGSTDDTHKDWIEMSSF